VDNKSMVEMQQQVLAPRLGALKPSPAQALDRATQRCPRIRGDRFPDRLAGQRLAEPPSRPVDRVALGH
jgi:hypothetical protein